jgi:tetratricopeptide (TPR) repeat protein
MKGRFTILLLIFAVVVISAFGQENTAYYWTSMGNEYFGKGSYALAESCFEKAIGINPLDKHAWSGKGNALGEQKKYNESIIALDAAIALSNDNVTSAYDWFAKGTDYMSMGNYDAAIRSYEMTIETYPPLASEVNPQIARAWLFKGRVLEDLNNFDEAIQCYEKAVETNPSLESEIDLNQTLGGVWYSKGRVLKDLGKTAESDAAFNKAKQLGYKDITYFLNRSRSG